MAADAVTDADAANVFKSAACPRAGRVETCAGQQEAAPVAVSSCSSSNLLHDEQSGRVSETHGTANVRALNFKRKKKLDEYRLGQNKEGLLARAGSIHLLRSGNNLFLCAARPTDPTVLIVSPFPFFRREGKLMTLRNSSEPSIRAGKTKSSGDIPPGSSKNCPAIQVGLRAIIRRTLTASLLPRNLHNPVLADLKKSGHRGSEIQ